MNALNDSPSQPIKTTQSSKLPPFVMNFLIKNKIKIIPRSNKSKNSQNLAKEGKLEKTIDSILQCRSPRAIQKAYDCLRKIVFNSPPFLQAEFSPLLYYYFYTLGAQLRKLNYLQEFHKFIDKYKGDFSKQQLDNINHELIENFDPDKDQNFKMNLSQFAVYDLTLKFRQYDSVLLPYVFENWISVNIVPFRTLNVVNQDQTQENFPTSISEMQLENDGEFQPFYKVDLNPALYQGDSSFISSNISTEGEFYDSEKRITDVPDIIHFTLFNHNNTVNDIKISRSAELLAYSQNSHVTMHSLNSKMVFPNRKTQEILLTHKNKIMALTFSPNSTLVASASIDGEIRVAHTEACHEICHYDYHVKPVYDLSFDSNNFFLSAASHDRTISMWAMNNVGIIRQFIGHKQPVVKTLFLPNRPDSNSNSPILISASTDSKIRLWDVGTAKMINQLDFTDDTPTALAYNPEMNCIACGGLKGTVILYDINAPDVCTNQLQASSNDYNCQINDVKFTNDGKWLLAGSSSGKIFAWSFSGDQDDVCEAQASTIDSICISNQNLIITTGRSLKGFNYNELGGIQMQGQISSQTNS